MRLGCVGFGGRKSDLKSDFNAARAFRDLKSETRPVPLSTPAEFLIRKAVRPRVGERRKGMLTKTGRREQSFKERAS